MNIFNWRAKLGIDKPAMQFNYLYLAIVGGWLILVPIVELILDKLFSEFNTSWQFQLHKLAYIILISLSFKFGAKKQIILKVNDNLRELYQFNRFMLQVYVLLVGCLVMAHYDYLILPITYLVIGLSFYSWGHMILSQLSRVGLVYILLGVVFLLIRVIWYQHIWQFEIILLGLSYIVLALWAKRKILQDSFMNNHQKIININSANRQLEFSGRKLIVIVVVLALVPLLELLLNSTLQNFADWQQIVLHLAFYYLLILSGLRLVGVKKVFQKEVPEVLQQALKLHGVILYTLALLDIALALGQLSELILPLSFIWLGLLFNLFGRFSLREIILVSQSYILLGILGISFINYLPPYSWIIEIIYLGLSYILIGIILEYRSSNLYMKNKLV